MPFPLRRRRVFGFDFVDAAAMDEVVGAFAAVPRGEAVVTPGQLPVVVTLNVDQLVRLERQADATSEAVIRNAVVVLPDGQPIVWASRLLHTPLASRLPGSTLVAKLWPELIRQERPVAVIAGNDTITALVEGEPGHTSALTAPWLDLADRPHFDAFADECVAHLREHAPEFVFVALSEPKQSNLIDGILRGWQPDMGAVPLFFAVGASFDMHYGLKRRAPGWVQRLGAEWLYRFVQEPRRLFRRYFVDDPYFFAMVWREWRRTPASASSST